MNIRDWLFVEDHAKTIDMVINGEDLEKFTMLVDIMKELTYK